MIKIKSVSSLLIVFVLALILLVIPVVKAEDAVVENESESTTESFYEQKQKRLEELREEAEKKREEAKEKAREQVESAKLKAEAKKQELRISNCEARLSALQNKISATSAAARRHQDKLDWFNDKIEAYIIKSGVTVTNGVDLTKAVSDAAGTSEDAVLALEAFDAEVDCNNIDSATAKIVEYKGLLTEAKVALQTYRTSTKNWLVAVKTASEQAENGTNSSQEGVN